MIRHLRRIPGISAVAVIVALTSACGGGDPAGPAPGPDEDLSSPVGKFTLATVNGESVPMLWSEMDVDLDEPLRAYWTGGSIDFRTDSSFTAVYRHRLTGPLLPGNEQQDTITGTWRLAPGAKIELHRGGGVEYLQTTDLIYSVTRTTTVPALDGGDEQVVFVFVRE